MLNAPAPAPPPESLRDELSSLIGDEVMRPLSRPPECTLEKPPNRSRGRQRAVDREAHYTPGEVVDDNREPPAKWPDLRQGERNPRGPEAQRGGDGRQVHVPEMIWLAGGDDARGRLKNLPRF